MVRIGKHVRTTPIASEQQARGKRLVGDGLFEKLFKLDTCRLFVAYMELDRLAGTNIITY